MNEPTKEAKVLPFKSAEEREIEQLHLEVDSLKKEVQSLSENLTSLMRTVVEDLEWMQRAYTAR